MLFLLQTQMMTFYILLQNDDKVLFLYMLFYISSPHIIIDFANEVTFVKDLPCQTLDWL